jgi:hypothetical protein
MSVGLPNISNIVKSLTKVGNFIALEQAGKELEIENMSPDTKISDALRQLGLGGYRVQNQQFVTPEEIDTDKTFREIL